MRNRIKNRGVLSAFCIVALCAAVLTGCSSGSGGGGILAAKVNLTSAGMFASALCFQGESLADGATVTINDITVPAIPYLGNFGTVAPAAAAGDPVKLHFAYEDINVTSTLTMPGAPTGVGQGANSSVSSDIVVNWTAPLVSPPSSYTITISSNTVSGDDITATVAGGITSYTIHAGTLVANKAVFVTVEAMNQTTNLGSSVDAGSVYEVGNEADFIVINTLP